jgi:hypothetical protein
MTFNIALQAAHARVEEEKGALQDSISSEST